MSLAIEVKNVSKHYPYYHYITGGFKHFLFNFPKAIRSLESMKFEALKDISFSIEKGESVGLIGRNGAGKSTMLGLIAGVLRPSTGSIKVNGRVSPLLELGGGFHQELSGVENIKLNGVLLGLSRQQVKDKIEEIIDFSELGDFINHPIRTYSSGMMARLGFSVVAHLEPEILLIDEVLGVGDIAFHEKCRLKIEDFKKNGVTLILVSHSSSDVLANCNRAIWIHDHSIKNDGKSNFVVKDYLEHFEKNNNY